MPAAATVMDALACAVQLIILLALIPGGEGRVDQDNIVHDPSNVIVATSDPPALNMRIQQKGIIIATVENSSA